MHVNRSERDAGLSGANWGSDGSEGARAMMSDSHGTIMEILSWSKLSEGSHCLKQSKMVEYFNLGLYLVVSDHSANIHLANPFPGPRPHKLLCQRSSLVNHEILNDLEDHLNKSTQVTSTVFKNDPNRNHAA